MTAAKKFLTADDRDDVALLINEAVLKLEALQGELPPTVILELDKPIIQMHKGLRVLEQNGASTRIPGQGFKAKQSQVMQ